jgi:dipeptidyl aminopeptidase/acylaminoacyl peptidase
MFGPYDLISFIYRLPQTWQTYFALSVGHPERDKDFLIERSPKTYLKNIKCPMLIIQGKNDPRVIAAESKDVVDDLNANGVETEFLVFEDEGHDVIKFKNKVICYTKIIDFFKKHLNP